MSFRRRLTYALFFFGAIFLIVPILVFYHQVKATLSQNLDDALRSVARAEIASAFDDPDEGPHIHEPSSPFILPNSGFPQVSWILNQRDEVMAKSSELEEKEILEVAEQLPELVSEATFTTVELKGTSYRVFLTSLSHRGETYTEVVGLSREPLLESLSSLKKQGGLMFLAALGVLILAAKSLSVRLTTPLTNLAEELEGLDPALETSLSLENKPKDKELQVLYNSVNSVLERLQYALEAQKHFVSDTSHEIRAPLTNLRLALEVSLRKNRSPEEYREVLAVCEQEVSRLGFMAERLLTLSRLDSQQLDLSMQNADLVRLVTDAVELVSESLDQRGIVLEVKGPQEICLQCDPGAVRQIVDNLLDNAICYAPQGSTVQIRLDLEEKLVRFSIENGGSQLSPEQCSRVFERFFRGDLSRQRETGGAGLGLSIVKGLVTAHKGQLGVDRLKGDRIRFWFVLPL